MRNTTNMILAAIGGCILGALLMMPRMIDNDVPVATQERAAACTLPADLAIGQQWLMTQSSGVPDLLPVRIAHLTDKTVGWTVELPELVLTKDRVYFYSRALLPTSGMCFVWQQIQVSRQASTPN